MLVGYHYDANCTHVISLKDRKGQSITEAWCELNNIFKKAGVAPETFVLDNETSKELIEAFDNENISHQLSTPYKHRNNYAERATQTCNSHFKAGLAVTDPNFPSYELDRFILQANIALNLLKAARTNPKLSAYAHIYGNFDFTSTPMAPPGTKLFIHMHPDKRGSWELHGEPGWYVGPSLNHYRCVQCYVPRTRSIVNSDSVEFFPNKTPFPAVTMKDHLQQSASDLVSTLTNPPSTTVPSLSAGNDIENDILEIAKILKRVDDMPNISAICDTPLPRVALTMKSKFTPMKTPTTPPTPSAAPPTIIPHDEDECDAPSPRVGSQAPDPITVEALLNRSSLPKNARFRNSTNHRYPLRSRSNLIQHAHQNTNEENLADYTFNPTCSANLIYKDDGTKETIDSLLKGPHKSIWEQSLRNEWGRLA